MIIGSGCREHGDGTRVRPYADVDFDQLVSSWHETNRDSYPYVETHQKHALDEAKAFFRSHVLANCEVWVAVDSSTLLGLLALQIPWIRQFAVFPAYQRRGVGEALLGKARERSPGGLQLFTFQRNQPARAFYEKHGFAPVAFGVSPVPEAEPDVEYRWHPG
jgi:ribosomal protein S18 acetylase RimI-like enzyme